MKNGKEKKINNIIYELWTCTVRMWHICHCTTMYNTQRKKNDHCSQNRNKKVTKIQMKTRIRGVKKDREMTALLINWICKMLWFFSCVVPFVGTITQKPYYFIIFITWMSLVFVHEKWLSREEWISKWIKKTFFSFWINPKRTYHNDIHWHRTLIGQSVFKRWTTLFVVFRCVNTNNRRTNKLLVIGL